MPLLPKTQLSQNSFFIYFFLYSVGKGHNLCKCLLVVGIKNWKDIAPNFCLKQNTHFLCKVGMGYY